MKKLKILILLLFVHHAQSAIEDKPRISTSSGNLIFSTGDQKDISFSPGNGASVYVGDEDIVEVISDYRDLESEVGQIKTNLLGNNCNSSPCSNGASCVNLYNDYYCDCVGGYTGRGCTSDMDECATGTATCLNGGACINQSPGYSCQCSPEYYGQFCETNYDDCIDDRSKCDNGICFDLARNRTNTPNFECVCNLGWQKDGNGICSRDINECLNSPCYVGVQCFNTLGSYFCGSCPDGYQGNGQHCEDINECLTNNGGCSQSPPVDCINEPGSSSCGPCPAGYEGNGYYCDPSSPCSINNGGCFPGANCTDAPELGQNAVRCDCPEGTTGNGYGPNGCEEVPACTDACVNGLCFMNDICLCFVGWQGQWCDQPMGQALCDSSPCLNGGTCTAEGSSYYCECAPGWTGANCQQAAQECGGSYFANAGNVVYPRNPGTGHSNTCVWYIEVNRDKAVNLTFSDFSLECPANTLTIYDGSTTDDDSFGEYCSDTPPQITTNSNYVTIEFIPGGNSIGSFAFRWDITEKTCGTDFVGVESGLIKSPNYPENYDLNLDCYWTIQLNSGYVVSFTFGEIKIETHATCAFDYLLIRDGILPSSPELLRLCSTQTPAPLSTSGPAAWVHFHTDGSITDQGFSISWEAVEDPDSCGGVLQDGEGTITSPGYPNMYSSGATCYWTVIGAPDDIVALQFTDMDIENSADCVFDYVKVTAGDNEDAPVIGKFCGTTVPGELRSTNNMMWIAFVTDNSIHGRGFSANYYTVCGGSLTEEGQLFHSPGFPGAYEHETDCSWIATGPENSVIVLTFLLFDVEGLHNGGANLCYFDYVEVHDGADGNAPLIGRYCGPQTPPQTMSTGNLMYIRFKTDASINGDGFQARINFDDTGTGGCGGVFTAPSGVFTTPGHPNNYPHGANCTWFINAEPGYVIELQFGTFSLEGSDCRYDYVRIFDGMFIDESTALGPKYCSTNAPPTTTSTGEHMTVQFVSDTSIASIGFSASYTTLDFGSQCGGDITSPSGEITSPNYPNNYPLNRECVWIITAPNNQQIQGQFNDFRLENPVGSDCRYDFLELRNGDQSNSTLIGTYCGTVTPPSFTTAHNHLWMRFSSDSSVTRPGFRMAYDATVEGCGGALIGMSGGLHSPNYPFAYNHAADCQYLVQTSEAATLIITFTDFDLEGTGTTCSYDWVQIFDGPTTGDDPITPRLCGSTLPDPVYSLTNKALIEFRTDNSISGRGWVFNWDSNYNTTIYWPFEGLIQSPNYPYMYPNNMEAYWRVVGPLGSTIDFQFNNLDIEFCSTSCTCDVLEIFDGLTEDDTSLLKACGSEIPTRTSTTGNEALLKFMSDALTSGNGFELRYIINACGDTFTAPSATISSPGWPSTLTSPQECYYMITIEPGMKIQVDIRTLQLNNPDCDASYLKLYNGPFAVEQAELRTYCSQSTGRQQSTGAEMILKFKTDNQPSRFQIDYQSLPGGCGGHYISESGVIQSPNFPAPYPPNSDCEWLIDTQAGNTVNLYFEQFALEGSGTYCYFDYVRVYDGPNMTFPLIGTFCGRTVPEPVRTSQNHMFVQFQSDSSVQYGGFKATFNTNTCGNIIVADDDGNIQSPGYPGSYPQNSQCTWEIKAPATSQKILLQFSHLDTFVDPLSGNAETCANSDFVIIYEGQPSPSTPKYCGTRLPPTYISSGWRVKVDLDARRSTFNTQRSGFFATYSTETEQCGGEYWSAEGYFSSPGYSTGAYAPSSTCEWLLTSSPGNKVSISFPEFDLENPSSSGTCYDYVEIREDSATGTLLRKFCGSTLPNDVATFTSHILYVKFYSNANNNVGAGFLAYYSHSYGGAIIGSESGQIASPLYPHNYPQLVDAYWTLYVRYHHLINYEFEVFATESHISCGFDWLRLYDGEDTSARLIGTFCGYNGPPPGTTSDHTMTLYFHSDEYYDEVGFLMNWNDTSQGDIPDDPNPPTVPPGLCGQDFVVVPNYPLPLTMWYTPDLYPQNLNCIWNLYTTPGSRIRFDVLSLDLEGSTPSCFFDYIQLYDGPSQSYPILSKTCGRTEELPLITQSSGDSMTVFFRTDSSINYGGFNATYQKGCGSTMQSRQGQINTPNFPQPYDDNLDCTWKVQVTNGYTVQLEFNRGLGGGFGIDGSGAYCNESDSKDYLEIRNGYEDDAPPLNAVTRDGGDADAYFCGRTAPSNLISSGNEVLINFKSDDIHSDTGSYPGFQLRYRAVGTGCGGDYVISESDPAGWFTSPNYPDNYDSNEFCIYTIRGDPGISIRLDFEEFKVEDSSGCIFDYVKIYDDEFDHDTPVATFCGTTIPDTVRITGHVMIVKFRTDVSITAKGFNATYSEDYCGGFQSGIGGMVSHHEYPDPYGSGALDCSYVVRAPLHHNVQAQFVDQFSVPGSPMSRCQGGDYVEFRDYLDAGYFYLRNPDTDLVVGINLAVSSDNVEAQSHTEGYNQLWLWDFDHIVSVYDDTKVLAADGPNPSASSNVHVETFTGALHQRWERTENGTFRNKNSTNLVLTITGTTAGSSVGLRTEAATPAANQIWNFEHTKIGRQLGIYCGTSAPTTVVSSSSEAMVIRHHSEEGNQGKWKIQWDASESECGAELTADSGVITSPNYPNPADANRVCTWLITADEDRSIRITFTDKPLGTLSCNYDNVRVFNGHSDSSPQFWDGRICPNSPPNQSFLSTGNKMKVVFTASNYGVNNGFRAEYNTNEQRYCGGRLELESVTDVGYLTSPEYPELYPNNTECQWLIRAPGNVNRTVFFDFIEFDLEHHDTCDADRLIFTLPAVGDGVIYNTICGSTPPPPFSIPSYEAGVIFQSDDLGHGKFNMSYAVKECGGLVIDQLQGVITSPNYPQPYGNNEYCIWVIVVEPGHSIGVYWDDFDVERHPSCDFDYVKLFNGPSIQDPMIGNYCNPNPNDPNYRPPDIHTASNYLTILFQSDFSVATAGWKLRWEADNSGCGNVVYHQSEGFIRSPGRPGNYQNNQNCKWTIYTEESSHVELTFTAFDLEGGSCIFDYVEIYDGDSEDYPVIGRYCGTNNPGVISSSKSTMLVRFRTDSSVVRTGFEANWVTNCGQNITATGDSQMDQGRIISPGHPANYANNLLCTWQLNGAGDTDFIRLNFLEFNLEYGSNCAFDWVKLYKGPNEADLIGKYCGTDLPPPVSTHGMLRLELRTDSSVVRTGFHALYDFEQCGGTQTGTSGTLNGLTPSDDWSEHRNQNCTWVIEAEDPEMVIEIKFSIFDIEYEPTCDHDYVAIYDGRDVNAMLIGKYCGSIPPAFVKSTTQYMTVEYITDFYETKEGFFLDWKQTPGPPTCGGVLLGRESESGTVTSPGYNGTDGLYMNNLNCLWVMQAEENKIWQINITDFYLEEHASSGGCYDYFEVIDGQYTTDHVIYRQCGNQTNVSLIQTSGRDARIRFRTDSSITRSGFSFDYMQVDSLCGATLSANSQQQTLTYNNVAFPGNSQIYRCTWFIQTTNPGKYVDFVTTQFSIPGTKANSCREGYLEFRDYGFNAEGGQVLRYCNGDSPSFAPPEFKSLGNTAQILLRNTMDQNASFALTYTETDCNREYNYDSWRFYSPGWPQHYPQYQNCMYQITVAEENRIQLYFNDFDLEHDPESCSMDYLAIYKGSVIAEQNKLAQYCGDTIPDPIFPENTNQALLNFRSDQLVSGKGFDLSYTSNPSQCGGNLTGTHGNVYMSWYPADYQAGMDCVWTIEVPPTRRVKIHFDQINILWNPDAGSCRGIDGIYAYNGYWPSTSFIVGYCGVGAVADVQGDSNVMSFRFRSAADTSDAERAGYNGFVIRWES